MSKIEFTEDLFMKHMGMMDIAQQMFPTCLKTEPSPEIVAEIEKMYGTIPEPPPQDDRART